MMRPALIFAFALAPLAADAQAPQRALPPVPTLQQPVAMPLPAPVAAVASSTGTSPAAVFTQSPAYKECTALANSNPLAAEQKAAEWLKIDDGIGAHHCRAMALYGQRRFPEAADELAFVRGKIAVSNIALRSYVARQGAKAWVDAGRPDAAVALLGNQIEEMSGQGGDNAEQSKLAADLLLDRARLRITYGQLAEAVQDLDHAVSLTPLSEEVLLERAAAFAQLGDKALAKQDVANVLKLNPNNAKAQALKRTLDKPNPVSGKTLQPLQ